MRPVLAVICLMLAGLGLAQPLPLTATIAGSRYGAIDIDVHPSGQYVALAVAGSGQSPYWIYQFETEHGQLVKKVPLSTSPWRVRYSSDGFWAVVSYGSGNCDIFRTPDWTPYDSIRRNNPYLGLAVFDGVSRHLGIEGEYIYRMSDLQPISATRQGNPYKFAAFVGLEAMIPNDFGQWRIIEAETLDETNAFSIPRPSSFVAPYRSGIFADAYPSLTFYEYDTWQKKVTKTLNTGRSGIQEPRLSPTAEFLTYSPNNDRTTLGVLGFDPVRFSVDDHFGYSGHLKTGGARGAVFAPPNWQLGDVRIASMTVGGDAGWLKMPEKSLLLDFLNHVGNVTQAASPTDSRELAVGANLGIGFHKGIRIWNIPDVGIPTVKKVLQSEDTVKVLHYYDGGLKLAAFHDTRIELWDLAGNGSAPTVVDIGAGIRTASVAQNMACITTLNNVVMVNLLTLQQNSVLSLTNGSGAFLSPDASLVAVCHNLGIVDIYSTTNFGQMRRYVALGPVQSVAWTKDGRYLFLSWNNHGGGNGSVTRLPLKFIWERAIHRNLNDQNASFLTLAPDGSSISAYTQYTNKLRILSAADLSDLNNYDSDVCGLPGPGGVTYFANGKRMSVASLDGPIGIMKNPVASKSVPGEGTNQGPSKGFAALK